MTKPKLSDRSKAVALTCYLHEVAKEAKKATDNEISAWLSNVENRNGPKIHLG